MTGGTAVARVGSRLATVWQSHGEANGSGKSEVGMGMSEKAVGVGVGVGVGMGTGMGMGLRMKRAGVCSCAIVCTQVGKERSLLTLEERAYVRLYVRSNP